MTQFMDLLPAETHLIVKKCNKTFYRVMIQPALTVWVQEPPEQLITLTVPFSAFP